MVKIADIVGSLGHCFEAQRELEQCRTRATGDVEYYSYSYVQDLKQAEMDLEQTLNAYIDQRVAERFEHLNTSPTLEQFAPGPRSPALVA